MIDIFFCVCLMREVLLFVIYPVAMFICTINLYKKLKCKTDCHFELAITASLLNGFYAIKRSKSSVKRLSDDI